MFFVAVVFSGLLIVSRFRIREVSFPSLSSSLYLTHKGLPSDMRSYLSLFRVLLQFVRGSAKRKEGNNWISPIGFLILLMTAHLLLMSFYLDNNSPKHVIFGPDCNHFGVATVYSWPAPVSDFPCSPLLTSTPVALSASISRDRDRQ